jgi:hypothetical protein
VSNGIRYDALLVHYLARELDARLRNRRLRGVRLDPSAHRLTLELDRERLVWELHPARGWIRVVQMEPGDNVAGAVEGWGARRVPIQRRGRVRGVAAPADERWLELEIDAGGADRAARLVVELMTNQWNVLALGPGGVILSALRTRRAGGRELRPGATYQPPGPGGRPAREGIDEPVDLDRWLALLGEVPPPDRPRALVQAVAWTSPLNAAAVLGIGDRTAVPLPEAWDRYTRLAVLPSPHPQLLGLGRPTPYPLPLPGVPGRPVPSLLAAFDQVRSEPSAVVAPEVRAALESRLRRARQRTERMRAEAASAPAEAVELRRRADLLMAQLRRVARGDRAVVLDDFEGGQVAMELDPALTPAENARVLYDRARKRERAAARLPERVREAVAEQYRLESLLRAVEEGRRDVPDLGRWVADTRPEDATGKETLRLPYHSFRSSGGLEIRVGRTGRANDDLTFRHSSPDDIWLHARDAAGAHVILRWGDRERNPPRRDLVEAAVLAALNSRARTSGTVPVDWTRRKHVRKPRKAPPGAVLPDRVATLFVEPDPTLPERLRPG